MNSSQISERSMKFLIIRKSCLGQIFYGFFKFLDRIDPQTHKIIDREESNTKKDIGFELDQQPTKQSILPLFSVIKSKKNEYNPMNS